MLACSASATITFPDSDIQYWVGTGSNQAVVVIGWDDNPSGSNFALAWGVRWNGSCTAVNMLDTIATYDSRVAYAISSGFVTSIGYNDGTLVSGSSDSYWCYTLNGGNAGAYSTQAMANGDIMEISSSCDFSLSTAMAATNPNGGNTTLPDTVDASLPFSEILYWVGSGTDSAEFIVNFANPDTAFAWGYLFNGSTTAQAMVDAIAAADPRFWTEGSPSLNGDIHFVIDNGDTLGLSPVDPTMGYNFWWTNLNGVSAGSGAASTLHNGYVFKYGDMNSATGWDALGSYYMEEAWNTIPTPVSVPTSGNTPTEATIAFSDILYWVGEGANEAVLAVNWADTALAWGYRWNGNATVESMMAAIAAADPRFDYSGTGWLNDITFNDGTVSLAGTPGNYWGSTNNGIMDAGMTQALANGDFEKWGDPAAGVIVDSNNYGGPVWYYTYAYPMTIYPVSVPLPVETTFPASAIEYWVGEGASQVVMAVNWPDTALAWGYRFDGTKTVSDMMTDIAAADPRFSFVPGGYGIDDILFARAAGDTLRRLATSYWGSTNNGVMDMGVGQTLTDGDFEKWTESSTGVFVDSTWVEDYGGYWSYNYVYPMEIHAASQPFGYGPFTGIVGSDGCEAIAANNAAILGWATACTLDLGPQNISVEGSPLVSYRTADEAIGPCSMNDNLSVVSLGDGGSATLTFAYPIKNGEGPDFAVYENSFDDYFLELAFVEVSSDGERFVRFPATSLTQTVRQIGGSGRVDATYINNLAGKYRTGYGTPFDLAELADSTGIDINNITHVRIVDVVGSIDPQYATYDAYGHMVNDPFPTNSYSSGFDLDGVAVLHQSTEGIDDAEVAVAVSVWPNPVSESLTVSGAAGSDALLYDMTGRQLASWTIVSDQQQLNTSALAQGVYMLRIGGQAFRVVKR